MSYLYVSVMLFLVALAVGAIVFSSGMKLWKKLSIVTLLCGSAIVSYRALDAVNGYAAILQNDFEDVMVIGFYADRENNVMFLWLLDEENGIPRSYKVPYSAKTHKGMQGAQERNGGKPFRARIKADVDPTNRYPNTTEGVAVEIQEEDPGDGMEGFFNLPPKPNNR